MASFTELQCFLMVFADPTPFFKALVSKPYRGQVILAPRISGPAKSKSSTSSSMPGSDTGAADESDSPATPQLPDDVHAGGSEPIKVLDNSFHQLSQNGFCVAEGNCTKFPVVVAQQSPNTDQSAQLGAAEQQDLELFASYIWAQRGSSGMAAEHDPPSGSWLHWGSTDEPVDGHAAKNARK